jgi:hypothetical protein
MRDRRLPPFVWQSRAAMDVVRHCFDGKERQTAVAIYQAMSTLANDQRGVNEFTASRKEIAELAGTSDRTIDRYAETFERVGLLEIERTEGGPSTAHSYTLIGDEAGSHRGEAASGGGAKPLRPLLDGEQEEQQEVPASAAGGDGQLFEAPPSPVKPAPDDLDPMVEEVWAHYVQTFGDRLRVKELTDPRRRAIRKALKAVQNDVALLKRAISGLKSYRASHPDGSQDISLSVVFETNMHSKSNLTDQIEWWSHQAQEAVPTNASVQIPIDLVGVPSVTKGSILARRREVARMYDHAGSAEAKERGEVAVDWLKEHIGHQPKVVDGELRGWELVER